MIAVDTSAIMAILLREAVAAACIKVLEAEDETLISAGTMAELLVVAAPRNIASDATELVDRLEIEIVPVTAIGSRRIGAAYARWGKGMHRASLNFGDCFAYALAKERNCRLLYVGDDFAKTDIKSAL